MKICWLVPDDYWGGVFPVSHEVCRQAIECGHEVRMLMVCKPANPPPAGTTVPIESLNLIPSAPNAATAILNWLNRKSFDALVLNCCSEADPLPPYLPDSLRCVYVVHNSPKRYWRPAVEHARSLDLIVAVSNYVADLVRPHLAIPGKLITIHNGSSYPEAPTETAARNEDLLFLGGEELRKGAGDLLHVWRKLVQCGFSGRLHWCGSLNEVFRRQVDALPARDRIEVHGRVTREEVFRLAAGCRVLLMLSRAEAFGMVTIEAMSMGCVPVAWDVDTGTKEIVTGAYGRFAPLGNYDKLARAVLDANAKHPALVRGVMHQARRTFSISRMWGDYERSISRVLKQPKATRPLAGQNAPSISVQRRSSALVPGPIKSVLKNLIQGDPRLAFWVNRYCGM
jgi:glycosyltransferase involved in cell wall biosynthesis